MSTYFLVSHRNKTVKIGREYKGNCKVIARSEGMQNFKTCNMDSLCQMV